MDIGQGKSPMYFNFDGGEVEFRGEKAVVKGTLLFDFVHEFRSPNFPAIQEIGLEVKKWLEDKLRESPDPDILESCSSLLKLAMHTLAHIQPEAYTRDKEDQLSMRKGFWLAVLSIVEWFTDQLDDGEKYRTDPHFPAMNKFFSSTLYKIFSFEFCTNEELEIYIEEFGLFRKNYKKFHQLFQLWLHFATGFFADPLMQKLGINRKKMAVLGDLLEQEYMSSSWMDGPGLEKVHNFYLYANKRVQNGGGLVQIAMCGIMDGFYEPEFNYIFREQHVEHFRFLCIVIIAQVHDVMSFKKDVREGDTNNCILMWTKKGNSLQESVDKAIKKHDEVLLEARELYKFLQIEYKEDPKLLAYLDLVLKNFSGICQFQGLFCERYGDVKWSIDQEKNL